MDVDENKSGTYTHYSTINVKEGLVDSDSDGFSFKSKQGDNSSLCSQSSFLDNDCVMKSLHLKL